MAYLALLWKARTIEKYRLKYEKEKINSINSDKTELRSTLYEKWTVYHNDSQKKLGKICTNICPEGSKVANGCTFLKENSSFLLKIVIGIVGGILTYFLYKIFVFQDSAWTVFSWVVGVAIILGVTFSYRVRCLVLLLVPGLFSRVGRYTLACYALVLILTGPAANTLKNLDTLSASLACGQEQIKSSVKEIKESQDSPLNLVKETMSATVEKIECVAAKMQDMMVVIHRLTMSIAYVLQSSLSWLNSVETVCNTKLGTPYEHCSEILAHGAEDYQTKFPEFSSQWNWDLIVRSVCFTREPMDSLCVVGDFAKGSIVATVKKKLKTYSNRIQSLFNLGVHIRRSHSACGNGSLPVSQAAAGIVTDLRNRADTLLAWLSWTCALTGLFLMLIIFRAKYYLLMFRTRSRFDNRYITKELRELDLKRQRQGRETVLPLNTRERAKYVSTASFRLLPSERMYLTRSIVFMVITTLKLMIHMVADYSLYWVLMSVRFHGRDHNSDLQRLSASNRTAATVSGSGPLAGAVRMLAEALGAPLSLPAAAACLPDPNPPDLRRYAQIGTLILLLWLLALFEPYGLRLRHVISAHYQPERAKARAVWLYYHIIRTRNCFLKFARRKLHRQYKYTSEEKSTFKRWLHDCIQCSWLRILLRVDPAEPHCLLCYTKHRQDDLDRHLKRCETPSCPGVYCARCFIDIGQLCTICYSPQDYGDLSDVSLEKFTSDESDSDVSDDDDNKPLLGTRGYENDDETGTHNNHKTAETEHDSDTLTPRRKNCKQESMPLLDCDYLQKNYSQQRMIPLKCKNNIRRQKDISTQVIVTGSEAKNLDVNSANVYNNAPQRNNPSAKGSRLKMVFRDTEVGVNGITFPKGKLSAIVRTMMLLTSKDEKYDKCRNDVNKHKPFEYLVMEMFQPSVICQRILSARRIKSATCRSRSGTQDINGPVKSEILYLFHNPVLAKKSRNSKTLGNIELQTDYNFKNSESIRKCVQSDLHYNYDSLSKRVKKMRNSRRKVKRFLDLKETVANTLRESLSKSRIYCNRHKLTSERRRRSKQHYKCLKIISTVSKVFSNKLMTYIGIHSLHDTLDLDVERNKPPKTTAKAVKRGNPTQPDSRPLADQANQVSQETDCSIRNNEQNLSNFATGEVIYMNPAEGSSGESPSKESDESNGIETDNNNPEYKTVQVQTRQKNHKRHGFWESLRLRRRRTQSPRLFFTNARDDPSFYNFFANHKRRKKIQNNEKNDKVNLKAMNVNVNAPSYRVGFCLKDAELSKKLAKYSGFMDMENNELGTDCEITEERELLKRQEIKDAQHETTSRFNEGEIEQTVFKAKSTGGKKNDKEGDYDVRPPKEFLILYDDKDDDIAQETSRKLFNISRKLKSTISQIACNLAKIPKRARSVVFSEVDLKKNEQDLNEDKPWVLLVDSNENIKKESQYHEIKCLTDDSSDEQTETENRVQIVQDYRCLTNQVEEDESGTSYIEMKPLFEGNTHRQTETGPCDHTWKVKPKKQEACQTKGSVDESSSHDSWPDMVHRCFQVKTNLEEKVNNITDASLQSLENSKRTQIKRACSCLKIENEDSLIEKERRCKCEDTSLCPWNQRKQNPRGYIGKRIESCLPMYHTSAVQSSDIETEKTITTVGASKYLRCPLKPYKGRIIKEVTERLIWPTDSICSQVTLEYADERAPRPKNRNVTLVANRSTTTMTKTVADVSTITSDWWSPMFERKVQNLPTRAVQTKKGGIMTENDMQEGKGLAAADQWGSSFYLDDPRGVLSASNYLIQSEQYYAQMYSMEMKSSSRGSHVPRRNAVSERPSFKHYHHLRKGTKTKRLKECYSSRKKMQSSSINLAPPKWRPVVTEEQAHALKYYKRRNPKKKMSFNSKIRKLSQEKESCKHSQTNSNMWTASIFSSSF